MDKLRVAVYGAGFIGALHAKIFANMPNVELKAICDPVVDRARQVAQELGINAYRSYEEVLEKEEVDAVSVCTSDQLHYEPVVESCKAKKHVFVEKPMALTIEECDGMIRAAKENGVTLTAGHILRFDPRYYNGYRKIRQGEIGNLSHFYARRNNRLSDARRLEGRAGRRTIIFHCAVHDLDIMMWYANSRVKEVYAYNRYEVLKDINSDDTVLSLLKFENGVLAIMENCWILPNEYPLRIDAYMEIVGDKGKLEVDVRDQGLVKYDSDGVEYPDTGHWPELYHKVGGCLEQELFFFVERVLANEEPLVTGEDARKTIVVANAIDESLDKGKPISINW